MVKRENMFEREEIEGSNALTDRSERALLRLLREIEEAREQMRQEDEFNSCPFNAVVIEKCLLAATGDINTLISESIASDVERVSEEVEDIGHKALRVSSEEEARAVLRRAESAASEIVRLHEEESDFFL